jgi:hypothetical protein
MERASVGNLNRLAHHAETIVPRGDNYRSKNHKTNIINNTDGSAQGLVGISNVGGRSQQGCRNAEAFPAGVQA